MQTLTTRMVMVVSTVSDTPFALLRRARNFEYRDDDAALQAFSQFEDPMKALTEECLRVLKCISSTNQSVISSSKNSTSLRDASWSRFEDIGFSGALDDSDNDESEITRFQRTRNASNLNSGKGQGFNRMQSSANSISYDMDRPTTPSWADFMSAGFSNEAQQQSHSPLFLTPDQVLPPVQTSRRAASVTASLGGESELDPGELANITQFDLDDAFWWTWISSLAGEETMKRKAVFGRCALVETTIKKAKWIVIEEQVRGAEVLPESNAHTVERKRGFRSFSQRARNTFRKTNSKKEIVTPLQKSESIPELGRSRPKITIEQQNKIQTAAAALQQRKRLQENPQLNTRGRSAVEAEKSMALTTLPPVVLTEAMPAMKWANKFDKDAIREAYLANNSAGRGLGNPLPHSQSTPTLSKLDLHKDVSNAATSPTSDVTAVVDQGGDHLKGTRATKSETVPTLATELPRSSDSGISTSRPRLDLDEEPKPAALPSREASREPIDRTIDQSIGSSDSLAGPSSINTSGTVKQSSVPDPNLQPTPKPIEPSTAPGAKAKEPQNGGLRKMFGRKRPVIGSSKLPPSVEGRGRETENSDVETTSTLKPPSAVPARRRSVLRRKNGQTEPTSSSSTLPFDAAEPERSHKSVSDNVGTPQRPGGTQVEASSRPQAESRVKPPAPSAKPRDMPATYNPTVVDRTPKSTPYTPTPERSMGPRPGVSSQVDALFGPSQSGTSPTSTMEERSAVNEFSSFDQGPLPDIPAFVPDIGQDSSDNAITPYRRRSPVRHKKTEATPVPKPEVAQKVVPVKEEQAAVPDAKVSSQQERWARIKANAAERAARADEEKPGALPAKKGVESVEEESESLIRRAAIDRVVEGHTLTDIIAIESRVARIKARVAELTGNPNGPLSTA